MRIAIDLDGTLCEYGEWRGHDHFGPTLPDAHEAILQLFTEGHYLILYTTRLNPAMNAKEGISPTEIKKKITTWLNENGLGFFNEITGTKPLADVYIDDRAIRHYDWKETLHEMEAILSGNGKPKEARP